MTELNLCYIRAGNGFPELCIQRTKNDELEVYRLRDNQCENIHINLGMYLWRKAVPDET